MKFRFSLLVVTFFIFSNIISPQTQDSIPKSYELKEPQYIAWRKIYDDWMQKEYFKILIENKLK